MHVSRSHPWKKYKHTGASPWRFSHYNPLSRIMFQSWGATSQFHFVFSVHFSDMPPQNSSILFLHIKIVCSIWLWVKIAHPSNWMIDTKSDGHLPSPILKFWSTAICSDRISSLLDSISSFPMFRISLPRCILWCSLPDLASTTPAPERASENHTGSESGQPRAAWQILESVEGKKIRWTTTHYIMHI